MHSTEHAYSPARVEVSVATGRSGARITACRSHRPGCCHLLLRRFKFMTISRREMKLYRRKVIRPLGASSLSPPLSPCAATGREFDCVDDDLCGAVSSLPPASFRMSARLALREWHAWARQSRHFRVSMKKWNDGMPMKLCKWAFKTIRVRGWTRFVAGVCAR